MTFKEKIFFAMPIYTQAPAVGLPVVSAGVPVVPTSELWQRLRQARKYADLTQADLAKACGVTRGAVALWEASELEHRTRPTTDHLIQISKKTKVPLEWLLNDAATTESLWKWTGEFGEGDTPEVIPQVAPQATPQVAPEPDVLPDLRQGEHLFVFASTASQISAKLRTLASDSEATKKHLILIGVDANVSSVNTPTEALSAVVQTLSK